MLKDAREKFSKQGLASLANNSRFVVGENK